MPENTQIEYTLRELTEVMVRDQGLTDGHWQLVVRFSFAAATIDVPGEGLAPTVMSRVQSVGLARVAEPNPLSVNAGSSGAVVNRAARRTVTKTR